MNHVAHTRVLVGAQKSDGSSLAGSGDSNGPKKHVGNPVVAYSLGTNRLGLSRKDRMGSGASYSVTAVTPIWMKLGKSSAIH